MFSGWYSHEHQEAPHEKAARLLLELNLEQRKTPTKQSLDKIVSIKRQLHAFHHKDLDRAFNEVVDLHGWGDRRKNV